MKILVTRFFRNRALLQNLQKQKNFVFRECPLIDFEYFQVRSYPDTEWVFFTSKNSVISLPDSFWNTIVSKYKVGVTGKGTAEKIKEKGIAPNFTGDTRNGTEEVGKNFFQTHQPKSAWFPISSLSNKTIQKQAPVSTTIIETVSYETLLKKVQLQNEYDWYVFTSPSNVESFFAVNELPEKSNLLAMGQQTKNKLKTYTNKFIHTPDESSEEGLLNFFYDI